MMNPDYSTSVHRNGPLDAGEWNRKVITKMLAATLLPAQNYG